MQQHIQRERERESSRGLNKEGKRIIYEGFAAEICTMNLTKTPIEF